MTLLGIGFGDSSPVSYEKLSSNVWLIAIAPAVAVTAGRRWQRRGAIRTTLLNQLIICGYRLGVSPVRLARWYRGE